MPIQIDAKLSSFRRSSRGFYITLEVGPDSDWHELASAPLGQAFGVAMVAYDADTGKASPGEAASKPIAELSPTGQQRGEAGKPRRHFDELPLSQQAALLCQDLQFADWFLRLSGYSTSTSRDQNTIAQALRNHFEIASRSDLDNPLLDHTRAAFRVLVAKYREQTGRQAEQR